MTWEDLEKKYNIKFRLQDGAFRPVNEWLDDIYLIMTADELYNLLLDLYTLYGEELFSDLISHHK